MLASRRRCARKRHLQRQRERKCSIKCVKISFKASATILNIIDLGAALVQTQLSQLIAIPAGCSTSERGAKVNVTRDWLGALAQVASCGVAALLRGELQPALAVARLLKNLRKREDGWWLRGVRTEV